MSAASRTREEDLLREAYAAAIDISVDCGGTTHLEVSEEVWDYLMSIRSKDEDRSGHFICGDGQEILWGYAVVKQAAWEGFRIDVVSRTVIA